MLYLSSDTEEESVITVGRYEEAKPTFNCMLTRGGGASLGSDVSRRFSRLRSSHGTLPECPTKKEIVEISRCCTKTRVLQLVFWKCRWTIEH